MHDVVAACRESAVKEPVTRAGATIHRVCMVDNIYFLSLSVTREIFFCFRLVVFCGGNNGLSALDQ